MCLGGKKYLPGLIFILLVLCFYGCGKGDDGSGERLSGPMADSALPMRVDVTITPTITTTPQATETPQLEKNAQNQPKTSELEVRLTILTPTPDITPEVATPDPAEGTKTSQKEVVSEPSPTPLPMPTPTPEIESSASEDSLSEAVTKNAVVLQEKSSSPQSTLQPKQKESEVKEEKQLSPSQKDPTQQARITQAVSTKKEKIEKSAKVPTPTVTSYDGVTLDEITVCTKISNRNPSGAADTFSLSKVKKVYTWMRVSGAKPPMVLKHMYYWEGKLVATVKLKIKYPSMRTWSQKTFKPLESLGKWKVLVTTENEDEIFAVTEFTVVP